MDLQHTTLHNKYMKARHINIKLVIGFCLGCPGQNLESRKTVVPVCVHINKDQHVTFKNVVATLTV